MPNFPSHERARVASNNSKKEEAWLKTNATFVQFYVDLLWPCFDFLFRMLKVAEARAVYGGDASKFFIDKPAKLSGIKVNAPLLHEKMQSVYANSDVLLFWEERERNK